MQTYGAIPKLAKLATDDGNQAVRKKAILALSSALRNCQPNLDALLKVLPRQDAADGSIDAADMGAIDTIVQKLRDESQQKG